jgi:hypothetical protein
VQADHPPESRLHSKLEPPSLDVNEKLAPVALVGSFG